MLSPLTGKSEAILVEKIDSQRIIDQYKNELNTDVGRFFANLSSVDIMQCPDTGYRFFSPFTVAGDGKFYEDLQNGYDAYYRDWKWENEFAATFLNKKMHILDIGCGKGAFLEKVQGKVASCVGLEFNDQAIEKAKKSGLDVRKEMIEDHAAAYPGHYDLICFFQVLEHINEVKSFLDAAIKALKPGGLLIIGVPNSDPWLLKYDKYHTLNLPPHHAGLWNKSVFQTFEQYFPLQLKSIGYEPLTAIRQQWKLVLAHKNHHFLLKIVEKLPSFVFSILGKVIGPYFPGNSIVAVFTKK